jgi:hypothetical protein
VSREVEVRATARPGGWVAEAGCLDVWRDLVRVGASERLGGACALPDGAQVLAWTWRAPCAGGVSADDMTLHVRVPLGHRVRTMPEIEALVDAIDETIRNASAACGR